MFLDFTLNFDTIYVYFKFKNKISKFFLKNLKNLSIYYIGGTKR